MLKNIIAPKQQRVDFPNLISKRVPNCQTVIWGHRFLVSLYPNKYGIFFDESHQKYSQFDNVSSQSRC